MHDMIAVKGFTNTRIQNDRNGAVLPGEAFKTDWLHAKELLQLGLAKMADDGELGDEPTDPVEPHFSISEPDLKAINDRRAAKRVGR